MDTLLNVKVTTTSVLDWYLAMNTWCLVFMSGKFILQA